MLSEYQLEKLLEAYEARMQKLTDEYIEMMGEHLKEIGKLKASDIHRLTELKRVGINAKAMQKKLVAASNKSVSELNEIFKAVAENDQRFAQQWFSSGYEPEVKGKPQMSKPIERILKAQLRITAQEFKNLSRTTIQTEAYRNAVDVAIQSVQAGVQDYKSAIRRAMKDAAEVGLRVKYPTGVTRRFDTAARQNILDGVREINNDILRQLGNEYGADGVEISAHALCAEDHLPYQGKQFTNKEFERIQNSLDRPFGQWNCKHTIYPIILGVSERANDDDTLEKYRTNSSELITIDGKTKSRYDWSQEQRKVETAVRTQKDIANLAKASGDDVARREAQAKINSLKEYYTRISDVAGLEADKTQMTVAGFRSVKAPKKQAQSTVQNAVQTNLQSGDEAGIMQSDKARERFVRKNGVLDGGYCNALIQRYEVGSDLARNVYDKFIPNGGAVSDGAHAGTANHSAATHTIQMNFAEDANNKRGAGTTWFHEHGHYLDMETHWCSVTSNLYQAIIKDCRDYEAKYAKDHGTQSKANTQFGVGVELILQGDTTHSIQDLFGASIGKPYPMTKWSHKSAYWKDQGNDGISKEAFAHMFEASFSTDKQTLMKKYLPTAWAQFEKLLEEALK